ncbi:MAG: phage head-tail joining protein [Paracoccus sp. (in: a-proteobacteria)]
MSVYTVDQYNTLCMMIGKGVTSLEVNGEKVTYRSLSEMMRIKAMMEADLNLGAAQQSRRHFPVYRKD